MAVTQTSPASLPTPLPFPMNTQERQRLFASARLQGKSDADARDEVLTHEIKKVIRSVKYASWSKRLEHSDIHVYRGRDEDQDPEVCVRRGNSTYRYDRTVFKAFPPLPDGDYDWHEIKKSLLEYIIKDAPSRIARIEKAKKRAPGFAFVKKWRSALGYPAKLKGRNDKFSFHVRPDGSVGVCVGWFEADDALVTDLRQVLLKHGRI